uniref:NADH-ubiquinone oxidoreductase chain 6 n=1 Tax=Paracaecilius japanus TaxID=297965 RepID=A0A8K1ZG50_9NEOP|nr:NADH dehydrogenase subunit 6 [Paracaecilius japanus]
MTPIYLSISILLTFMFFFLVNPLSLGLILICQTITLALFLGTMLKSFWFMYLLMLVFIGGMLVLFIYATSIFPNEKFSFNQSMMIYVILAIGLFMTFLLMQYYFSFNLNSINLYTELMPSENNLLFSAMKMGTSQTNILLIFMVNYLFYCMIVVIKITNFFKGPLRMTK